jgi:putative inorganic carbon (HCO3(-)) transporter
VIDTRAQGTGFPLHLHLAVWKRPIALAALALFSFCALAVLVQRYDATVALALAALVTGTLVMMARPELATLLTVFLLYINFPAILTKQHGVPHVVAGSFILLLACPLMYSLIIRREPFKADRTFYLMVLLLAASLVSALTAIDKDIAIKTVQELALEGLLLYWLVFNAIRSMPTLRRVIWTLLAAGSLLSTLSLYQTVTGSYRQEFGGLAYRQFEAVQDVELRDGPAKRRTWDRAGGPQNEPNRFAQTLIVLIPLALYLYRNVPGAAARVCAAAFGALLVGGIMVTLSRGAFIALVLMAVMLTFIRWFKLSRVLVCVLLFAVAAPSVPFFAQRMQGITRLVNLGGGATAVESRTVDTSSLARVTLMLAATRVFFDHPVIGVGPGQFAHFYSQKYSADPEIKLRDLPPGNWRAHSLYLEIAAETGVIGISVFLAIVVTLLRELWRARRRWISHNPEFSDLATALCLSLIAYQLTGVFLHLSYQPYYWFLLALIGATLNILHFSSRERSCYPSR